MDHGNTKYLGLDASPRLDIFDMYSVIASKYTYAPLDISITARVNSVQMHFRTVHNMIVSFCENH